MFEHTIPHLCLKMPDGLIRSMIMKMVYPAMNRRVGAAKYIVDVSAMPIMRPPTRLPKTLPAPLKTITISATIVKGIPIYGCISNKGAISDPAAPVKARLKAKKYL